MRRSHATLTAMLCVGGICLACVTAPYTVTTHYRRTQSALVPAPSGPHATGVMAPEGRTTIEIAGEGQATGDATRTRANGALGHATPALWARLHLAHGVFDRLEIGAEFEIAPGGFARPNATDLAASLFASTWLVPGGFHLRGILIGTRRFGLGANVEASVGSVPYSTVIDTTTMSTSGSGSPGSTYTDERTFVVPFVRGGLFLHGMPTSGLALLGGILVQTAPQFDGEQNYWSTCYHSGLPLSTSSCTYNPNPWPSVYTLHAVGTLWASVSYTAGRITMVGQFFGNPLAESQWMTLAPYGSSLALRASF